jgi:hypothetical protein
MKICILSNANRSHYGVFTRPNFLAQGLTNLGHKVIHIRSYEGSGSFIKQFLHEEGLIKISFYKNLKKLVNRIRIICIIFIFNPQIIYSHETDNGIRNLYLKNIFIKAKYIYDAHTSIYYECKYLENFGDKLLRKIKNVEGEVYNQAYHIITVSKETKDFLKECYQVEDKKISIIKNATYIRSGTKINKLEISRLINYYNIKHDAYICLAVLPTVGFKSNDLALTFLYDIAIKIEKLDKNILFMVIGGGKKPAAKSDNVLLTGFVDDYIAHLDLADICLASFPVNAVCGGTRNKICDFFALGKPIISTKEGMRGFDDALPFEHYILADSIDDFVSKILYFKKHKNELNAFKHKVLELSRYYQWDVKSRELNDLLIKLSR